MIRPSSFFPVDTSRPIELSAPLNLCANKKCNAPLPGMRFRFCLACRRARAEGYNRGHARRKAKRNG